MISALYMEEAVRNHPRTRRLQARFPGVPHIVCERYGEIFNKSGQDFRLQKRAPALILAEKQGAHVLPTPPGYGIGGRANYYFSHILNCLYDCRYCFLQGLYQSAHYVFFLNFEDSQSEIDRLLAAHPEENSITFFPDTMAIRSPWKASPDLSPRISTFSAPSPRRPRAPDQEPSSTQAREGGSPSECRGGVQSHPRTGFPSV